MPTDSQVSPEKQKYIDSQNRYVGNTIGMGVAAAMDRSKTDDGHMINVYILSMLRLIMMMKTVKVDFKNICITKFRCNV